MKKICLIARQNVYTGVEHKIMDDYGLKAVDGIRYGKEKLINDNYTLSSIVNDLKHEFEKENPKWTADKYSIRFEDGSEIEI